jgi:hypothetical protein
VSKYHRNTDIQTISASKSHITHTIGLSSPNKHIHTRGQDSMGIQTHIQRHRTTDTYTSTHTRRRGSPNKHIHTRGRDSLGVQTHIQRHRHTDTHTHTKTPTHRHTHTKTPTHRHIHAIGLGPPNKHMSYPHI